MANDYIRLANELNNAGEYIHDLTRSMLQGFLHVSDSGDLMGTFNIKCQRLNAEIEEAISKTKQLSSSEADSYFAKRDLNYKGILRSIVSTYRALIDSKRWEPSKLPRDKQALSLVHQSKSSSTSNNQSSSKGKGKKTRTNKHHSNRNNRKAKQDMTGPRFVAPKPGEPSTKVINGNWCTKCFGGHGFWTKSHTSDTHSGSSAKDKSASTNSSNLAAFEPSFWTCMFDNDIGRDPVSEPFPTEKQHQL